MADLDKLETAINGLQKSIVRIETKLENHSDHEQRIRRLEQLQARHQWITTFATAGLTALVVYLIQISLTGAAS